MTLFPRPRPTFRRMPRAAFNQSVFLIPSDYPLTDQGGANPVPESGFPYEASVQAKVAGGNRVETKTGMAITPESRTRFDVLIAYEGSDAAIEALKVGDAITWGSLTLSVLAQANDMGGFGKVWHIPCELVNP